MVREKWYFIFTRKIHTASVLNPAGIGFSHSYPWHVASLNAAKMMSFYSFGHKGLKFILKEFYGFSCKYLWHFRKRKCFCPCLIKAQKKPSKILKTCILLHLHNVNKRASRLVSVRKYQL